MKSFFDFLLLPYSGRNKLERDISVWNSKKFTRRPLLVKEDKMILAYRRWFSQFYSENSPTLESLSKKNNLDWAAIPTEELQAWMGFKPRGFCMEVRPLTLTDRFLRTSLENLSTVSGANVRQKSSAKLVRISSKICGQVLRTCPQFLAPPGPISLEETYGCRWEMALTRSRQGDTRTPSGPATRSFRDS
ncbi:unnamed protein product [Notodromas monacha]|uniref:3-ketosteroid-9-alpha-monooxygenase oxygenase component-like C-terminal domain-containing protein n=1 Tax=Notodromas monacha TaxID=399045 RepID=A0A7R9BT44_9CRUS|nr:unnamed protein product [Notodromas monacha]CAG0920179.1 unnamed protein product [Notodromas monacha]